MGRIADFVSKHEARVGNWASILGFVALLVGIALDRLPSTPQEIVYASGYVLLCIGFILWAISYRVRIGRKARLAEAFPHLETAVRSILEQIRFSKRHNLAEKKKALSDVMRCLSFVFTLLTGSACRTCVKMVRRSSKKSQLLEVSTFCRNSDDQDAPGIHTIEHNTDFYDLYQNPKQKWFLGNNLPEMARRGGYQNSSKEWQSNYLATAVWPIREPTMDPQGSPVLVGFFCVDCKRVNAFSEEFDYSVGAMITNALCHFLVDFEDSVEPAKEDQVISARVSVPENRSSQVGQEGVPTEHEQ